MKELKVALETVTPMFLGGAKPRDSDNHEGEYDETDYR